MRKSIIARELERNRLTKTASAVAGLTGAVSAVTGSIAALVAPTGISGLAVLIGFTSPPIIVVAAPFVVGAATAVATFAGGMRFYSWIHDRRDEAREEANSNIVK